jgi:predicted acylesterase/phospholipase RssA
LESGVLKDVRDWYGCSAGTWCALFGAIGGTAKWLRDLVPHFDMSSLTQLEDDISSSFFNDFGIVTGREGLDLMKRFVDTWEPGCSAWTFADFERHRPGITLTMIAVNLSQRKLVVFNARNTPDVLLFDAMNASCAIPFYSVPWKHKNGDYYCDGGLIESYPWTCVTDKQNTIVIVCTDTEIGGRSVRQEIRSITDYMTAITQVIMKNKSEYSPKHWIAVNETDIQMLDLRMTVEQRNLLFEKGFVAAAGWLAFRKKVLASGSLESQLPCVGLHTSLSDHPSQNRTSDSPQCDSPLPPPSPALDSRGATRRPVRRWSL